MTARRATPEQIRECQRERRRELMDEYGAHALGVGYKRKRGRASKDLALIFYVESKEEDPDHPIPPTIHFDPHDGGEPVEVPTDVVESQVAELEGS